MSVPKGQGRKADVTKRGANCQARRSPEHAGLHIEDAIAASRHHLAGGFRGKIDEMPRRLIAVIVVSSVSAAFGFDREGFARLPA